MSPGPVLDFIDVPLEGIEGLGNRVEVQAVAKAIVLAGLKETDPAKKEQLDDASMGAALAADNVGINNELDMKVNGAQKQSRRHNLNQGAPRVLKRHGLAKKSNL